MFVRFLSAMLFVATVLSTSPKDATAASRTSMNAVAPSGHSPPHPETVLHVFGGLDGAFPFSNLIADAKGNLYGATGAGGGGLCPPTGCGTVFELSPPATGHTTWTERVLYAFTRKGPDGVQPVGGLLMDAHGALYGLTYSGGMPNAICSTGCGTVFKLTPPASNKSTWTESVLHSFTGSDGAVPEGNLIGDGSGALYGTTSSGGGGMQSCAGGCGTAFKLTPPASGQIAWTATVLHLFTGPDGALPYAGLIADKYGALYGTTYVGGSLMMQCSPGAGYYGCGTVFKLTPPARGQTTWTESVLYSFLSTADGENPLASLIVDANGSLYGTTAQGGITNSSCPQGCGTAFKVTAPMAGQTAWTKSMLHSFTGADGAFPEAGVTGDARGELYGTTRVGGLTSCSVGSGACGTVFKLTPANTAWTESVIHFFTGPKANGDGPAASLLNVNGYLYGTTLGDGSICNNNGGDRGTVFKIRL